MSLSVSKYSFYIVLFSLVSLMSCGEDIVEKVIAPEAYSFLRDGKSTVSFTGQTTRILMAEELVNASKNINSTETDLLNMFRNKDADGNDVDPFEFSELNASTKSIKSKVASSRDFFFTNTTETAQITNQFEKWIEGQVNEVFTNENVLSAPGVAGQIADGSTVRYINSKGLEYDQAISKGLIGALMVDQIVNNYLSSSVLDEAENRSNNDAEILEDGMTYTTMEHKWDEAFGYLFGNSSSPDSPLSNLGSDDNFLNKYVGRVDSDPDFTGIGQEIFDAFKLGRTAIVAKAYDVRDQQADIIKDRLSEVIAIRAVHYLQQGKNELPEDGNLNQYGAAFHNLSEGLGFVYSLRFTRKSGSNESYFTKTEVDKFIDSMINNKENGFWDLDGATLDNISNEITSKFDFTIEAAAE